ncbi:MAG TPA: DUF1684 domain-containing protein [Roseiflexaceae bacterium]|nr:DUF1684 domain-containing protein [Roseiflexaceae bacterium]
MSALTAFRESKDDFFKHHPQSPLTPEQQAVFHNLHYFPENEALRLIVTIEPFAEQQTVVMQTSTGDRAYYIRYGRFSFSVDGEPAELTIYADEQNFFLPFSDSLAGDETYGAGRYLEPEQIDEHRFLVDFNLAYNPYCAYNDDWSCPITPAENRLRIPIRAGEKVFH